MLPHDPPLWPIVYQQMQPWLEIASLALTQSR
jgi:hypothetical protein